MSEEWIVNKISSLIEVLDYMRVPINSGERVNRIGDVPYYGANGLQGYMDGFIFNEPLILIAEDGGNFDDFSFRPIAYRIEGHSWVNNHAHVVRSVDGVCQDFVFWSIVHKDIRRYITGGTRGKLTQTELQSIEITVPPLQEQKRIAEILDTLDETIRKTEQLIEKLKQMKQGLLHDLLTRGLDENGALRPPPEEAPHLYQESPLGFIPKEWRHVKLGDVVSFRGGFGFPDRFQGEACGDIPFYKVSDQSIEGNEKWMKDSNNYVSESVAFRNGWEIIPAMSVVFAKVGAALLLNRRRILTVDSLVDNNMMAAVSGGAVNAVWLYWFLTMVDFGVFVQPGVLPSVNQQQLSGVDVALPTVGEQTRVCETLDALERESEFQREQLKKLRVLKKGLMEDLLTGRVRVPTPAVEG